MSLFYGVVGLAPRKYAILIISSEGQAVLSKLGVSTYRIFSAPKSNSTAHGIACNSKHFSNVAAGNICVRRRHVPKHPKPRQISLHDSSTPYTYRANALGSAERASL